VSSTFLPLLSLQGESASYQNWLGDLNFDQDMPNPQLSGLYESTPLLPYDATDRDVLSMDLCAGPLHDLFNGCSTEPAVQGTGITILPRQSQSSVQQNNLFTDQGIANRRLRLQLPLSPNVDSGESAINVDSKMKHHALPLQSIWMKLWRSQLQRRVSHLMMRQSQQGLLLEAVSVLQVQVQLVHSHNRELR
jgi:hypothetical protein